MSETDEFAEIELLLEQYENTSSSIIFLSNPEKIRESLQSLYHNLQSLITIVQDYKLAQSEKILPIKEVLEAHYATFLEETAPDNAEVHTKVDQMLGLLSNVKEDILVVIDYYEDE